MVVGTSLNTLFKSKIDNKKTSTAVGLCLTEQKMKFSIKGFKCAGNCGFGHIYLLRKFLMENFIFYAEFFDKDFCV